MITKKLNDHFTLQYIISGSSPKTNLVTLHNHISIYSISSPLTKYIPPSDSSL